MRKDPLEGSACEKPPGSAVPTYRKSSASEYVEKKIVHKTLTPTRISNPNPAPKSKKKWSCNIIITPTASAIRWGSRILPPSLPTSGPLCRLTCGLLVLIAAVRGLIATWLGSAEIVGLDARWLLPGLRLCLQGWRPLLFALSAPFPRLSRFQYALFRVTLIFPSIKLLVSSNFPPIFAADPMLSSQLESYHW